MQSQDVMGDPPAPAQQQTGTPPAQRARISVANGFRRKLNLQGREVTILVFPDFFQSAEATIWPVRPEQKAANPNGPDVYMQITPKFVRPAGTQPQANTVMGVGGNTAPAPTGPQGNPGGGQGTDEIPF